MGKAAAFYSGRNGAILVFQMVRKDRGDFANFIERIETVDHHLFSTLRFAEA